MFFRECAGRSREPADREAGADETGWGWGRRRPPPTLHRPPLAQSQPRGGRGGWRRGQGRAPREAADERVHGVVARAQTRDGAPVPSHAQLGDLASSGGRVARPQGRCQAPLHSRGAATARYPPLGTRRLQVQATTQGSSRAMHCRSSDDEFN